MKAAEGRLRAAKAARRALDPPKTDEEPHWVTTYTGEQWVARQRGAFGPPRDTAAIAAHYLDQLGANGEG